MLRETLAGSPDEVLQSAVWGMCRNIGWRQAAAAKEVRSTAADNV